MKRLGVLLLILLLVPIALADSRYTKEKSEELFDLIEWYEYTPETFTLALEQQKPVYLVISAPAWCYWCHVYESEDYLFHPDLYPYINEHFISVFVDSDRRPDLTRKYLEGGWPSTTIFTPNLQRINGFTGPREPSGLLDYLESVNNWLAGQVFTSSFLELNYQETTPKIPDPQAIANLRQGVLPFFKQRFDKTYGGFGPNEAPEWREGQKFPAPLVYKFMLEE